MRDFSGLPKQQVVTLQDLVFSMTIRLGSNPSTQNDARVVKAIQSALTALAGKHNWNYYRRQTRFTTSARTASTIAYDHTGGSKEKLATISSGDNWPSDASMGEVIHGYRTYRILERISNVQATMEVDMSMLADFNGDVLWQRPSYLFTREVARVHYVRNLDTNRQLTIIQPTQFDALQHRTLGPGIVRHFTWQNQGGQFGGSEFTLYPPPLTAETIEVTASVVPHKPTIKAVTGVDAHASGTGSTLTCPSANFNDRLVGCIVRVARDATIPIDYNSDNWASQAFVVSVDSPTQLTLSEPLSFPHVANGYCISSPIDVEASVMLEALEDETFYQYTKNHSHEKLRDAAQMSQKSLREAMTRDNRASVNNYDIGYDFYDPFRFTGVIDNTGATSTLSIGEKTLFLGTLPLITACDQNDQVFINSGDLEGAIYELLDGAWMFQGVYRHATRTSDPSTTSLPTGFQWRLTHQSDPTRNGIWEWDGYNPFQRSQD
jgi:hypothetical protein